MKSKTTAVMAALLLACLLTACGKKDTAPAVYTVGTDEVVSLDSIMGEGEALLSSVDSPTEEAVAAGIEEYTYHYRQMADPAELSAEYIAVLRGAEQGFVPTDELNQQLAEEPVLDTLTGTVILEKKSAEEPAEGERGKIFRVIVAWSEFAMAVEVSHQTGTILPPPVEEIEEETPAQPTGLMEQLDYFNALRPEDIGLEGDNMADYMVYPKEGWVLVDSYSCRELRVYLEDVRDGSNVYMGTYYLTSDLTQLYQKKDDGSIVRLELPEQP